MVTRAFYRYAVFAAIILMIGRGTIEGATLSFAVTPQAASGDDLVVALQIAGLGDGTAPSLRTFDLNVFYPGFLAAPTVTFGDQLDISGLGTLHDAIHGPGLVNVWEFTFDEEAELNTDQAAAFTLATLTFAPLASGTGQISGTLNEELGDSDGLSTIPVDSWAAVDVTVQAAQAVPEPATLLFVGWGVAAVAAGRRRRSPTRLSSAPDGSALQ